MLYVEVLEGYSSKYVTMMMVTIITIAIPTRVFSFCFSPLAFYTIGQKIITIKLLFVLL